MPVQMTLEFELLNILTHFLLCISLYNGILLVVKRKSSVRPRVLLALPFFAMAVTMLLRVHFFYFAPGTDYKVLYMSKLNVILFLEILFYLYPIEVIKPRWLNWKKTLLLFSPWILINIILLLFHIEFRPVWTFGEMCQHIGEFNILFRLFVLFLYIIPYPLMLFWIPYNWRKSGATRNWIVKYAFAIQGIGILFSIFSLTGSSFFNLLYVAYNLMFCIYVTYMEFNTRLFVPASIQNGEEGVTIDNAPEALINNGPEVSIIKKEEPETTNKILWKKLYRQIEEEELWRNPDISLEYLAKNIGTNRTTLANIIHENGFDSYKTLINRKRIKEVVRILTEEKTANIQEAFFWSGFRSRITATRYFREYMNCTPTEFIEKLESACTNKE